MARFNFLRKLRLGARLSMASVGRCYRAGVTKQRIVQLEVLKCVSAEVERDYRSAVDQALQQAEHVINLAIKLEKEESARF
jgi:hypothetical protein